MRGARPKRQEIKAVMQSGEDLIQGQRRQARRRELNRQRDSVEPLANLASDVQIRNGWFESGIDCFRAVHEQQYGLDVLNVLDNLVAIAGRDQSANDPRALTNGSERLTTRCQDA